MKKRNKIILLSVSGGLILSSLVALLVCGYKWGIPPFGFLRDLRLVGNNAEYDLDNVEVLEDNELTNKNICYLGSSVTYGQSSNGVAFPEYIAKRNKTTYLKEAVSGSTLTLGNNSYIERMEKIDTNNKFDLFVCQLSTNDASKNKELGDLNSSDKNTVCGAINYIIDYAKNTFKCPIVFYSNSYYQNNNYTKMVEALNNISNINDIYFLDLYSDSEFNNISKEERKLYMDDNIHPTKAGYLKWWTPKFEEMFKSILK